MVKLTPEQYSKALQEIHKNYTNLREKVVESKLANKEVQESLEEFHEPVTQTIHQTTGQIENRLEEQSDAIEQAAQALKSIASVSRVPLTYKSSQEDSDSEFYTPSATPSAHATKKRKLRDQEVLSGHLDFDKPLREIMEEDDNFFEEFSVSRLNDIYKAIMENDKVEQRIALVKQYRASLFPKLLKLSQSFAGRKKQGKVWDEGEILKLLNDTDMNPFEHDMLEERLKILRKQKFVSEYRKAFKLLETNVCNPTIIQVQYGNGSQVYTNLDDMVDRLVLIRGNIEGGNNSPVVINEARAICDQLYKYKAVTKNQYKKLYQKFK